MSIIERLNPVIAAEVARIRPGIDTDMLVKAARDATWFGAPGLSDADHTKWIAWLITGESCDDDTPIKYWIDARDRFAFNLLAIASGCPYAIDHLRGIPTT